MPVRVQVVFETDGPAGDGVDAQQREVTARDQLSIGCGFDASIDADIEPRGSEGCDVCEHGVRVSNATVLLVLEPAAVSVCLAWHEKLQSGRIFDRQHPEQHRIDEAEDRRVGTDTERE